MNGLLEVISCEAVADVHVILPVRKECPVKNEADFGTVDVWFTTRTQTIELHSLRNYIESYQGIPITHEDFARQVYRDIVSTGVDEVSVSASWRMDGLQAIVAVPRERL